MDGKEVIASLGTLLNLEPQDFVVWYGAEAGADLDLLCVAGDSHEWGWDVAGIDMFALGHRNLSNRIRALDPRVTEPLLTGRLALGSARALEDAREAVLAVEPDIEVARGLWWEGISLLNMLRHRKDQLSFGSRVRLLTDMGYSLSLRLFAEAYARPEQTEVLTLSQVSSGDPLFQDLRGSLKEAKRGSPAADVDLQDLLDRLETRWIGWS